MTHEPKVHVTQDLVEFEVVAPFRGSCRARALCEVKPAKGFRSAYI